MTCTSPNSSVESCRFFESLIPFMSWFCHLVIISSKYMLKVPLIDSQIAYSLHGVESFLRSQKFFSHSRNSPHFIKPESSLPHSQMPASCPYREPARSSPLKPTSHFLKFHFNIIIPYPLAAAVREHSLYTILKFHVPNLMSIFSVLISS